MKKHIVMVCYRFLLFEFVVFTRCNIVKESEFLDQIISEKIHFHKWQQSRSRSGKAARLGDFRLGKTSQTHKSDFMSLPAFIFPSMKQKKKNFSYVCVGFSFFLRRDVAFPPVSIDNVVKKGNLTQAQIFFQFSSFFHHLHPRTHLQISPSFLSPHAFHELQVT